MEKKKFLKHSIIGLIIIAGLSVTGYFGYNYYLKFKREVTPVIHAVPGNSTAILEISSPKEFWNNFKKKEFFRQIQDFEQVENVIADIYKADSLTDESQYFNKWLTNNRMLLSLHYRGSNRFSLLGLLQMPDTRQNKNVVDFFSEHFATELEYEEPHKVYKVTVNDSSDFYFSVPEGILLISKDNNLIRQALNFLQNDKHVLKIENFRKVYNYRGKNVNANLYFNHNGLHRFLAQFANKKHSGDFAKIASYGSWAELDLLLEDKGLWFSGNTIVDDSSQYYLKIFQNQKADKIRVPEILPVRTALLTYYGMKDFEKFYEDYRRKLNNKNTQREYLENFMEKYELDISTYLFSWIEKEFARAVVKSTKGEYYEYVVMRTRDQKESRQSLNKLINTINKKDNKETDTLKYGGFEIKQIRDPYMFPMLFGEKFKAFADPYYSIIGDYVVVSHSVEAIKYALNSYILNNTLDKNEQYVDFADKITGQANVYVYYNLRYAIDYLLPILSPKFKEFFEQNRTEISDIPYGGIQYQYQEDKIYTNIYIKSDTVDVEENKQSWQLALDAPLAKAPEFVVDHHTKQKKIVAFDQERNMYLIDLSGKILWKKKIKEIPYGEIELIDFYDNDKYQYLFSSPNYINCIDLNGENVEGFPFKTKEKITNPLVALDYKGNKDYRIIMAGKDKTIYNYLKEGKITRGWEKPQAQYKVKNKVQHIVLGDKDFIIVSDTAGNASFFNRKGEKRISPEPGFTNNPNTPFFEVEKDDEEFMMTTDQGGRLIYVDSEGNVEKVELNDFTANHTFLYEDFDKDGQKDFVYFDEGYFYVYDKSYKVLTTEKLDVKAIADITYCPVNEDSASVIIREKDNQLKQITMAGVEKFDEPLFSEYSLLFYDNPASRNKNLILSLGKRIESVPVN
ncbi:MAG: DUF3352 domain-containing protein [Bacteroidales bacterium]